MMIGAVVTAELKMLSEALHDPDEDRAPGVMETVLALAGGARTAVGSVLGMTVTLSLHGDERSDQVVLRFTVLEDHASAADIASSLRLPRRRQDLDLGRSVVTVVLYAATPGAFVDMAADLTFLSGPGFDDTELDQHRSLAFAADVTGVLREESTVREATGVLLDRGRTREQAVAEIDALADAAGTSRLVAAGRLLDGLTSAGPGD